MVPATTSSGHRPGRVTSPPAADTLHLVVDNDPYQPRLRIQVDGPALNGGPLCIGVFNWEAGPWPIIGSISGSLKTWA